jgi:hypothetical protein
MHPLYRPIVLIVWLCAVIIGLNVVALWFIDARMPSPSLKSNPVATMPIRLEPPPKVTPCEPTVDATQIAERDTVIARLKADLERVKSTQADDSSAWRHKADQLEHDLREIQKVAERVVEMPDKNWEEGKLMLAHALVKKKT